jgi:hypothetical protein
MEFHFGSRRIDQSPHHIRPNRRQSELGPVFLRKIENALTKLLKYTAVMSEAFHRANSTIRRSSPSLPHTGHKHRRRTSSVFIIDLRWRCRRSISYGRFRHHAGIGTTRSIPRGICGASLAQIGFRPSILAAHDRHPSCSVCFDDHHRRRILVHGGRVARTESSPCNRLQMRHPRRRRSRHR